MKQLKPSAPARTFPRDHCTGCQRTVSARFDIARHNIECAETGERSYVGHVPYRGLAHLEREIMDRVAARLAAVDPKAANALARTS